MQYDLIATSTFGIEAITASELKALGYKDINTENGRVTFKGDERDIARTNIWLRTSDRVLIKMAEFKAESFEELFQGTKAIDWWKIIPENGKMHITGKSVRSKLFSVSDCQSIVKKAVVEAMKRKYKRDVFTEDGPVYKIEVGILKDIVTLTIDTSGPGLHKRGYRENAGEAPLKETLAAALVLISKWNPDILLYDPFCGSGTIPVEAALIGKNIAPGLRRSFVSEDWPNIKKSIWQEVRREAEAAINDKEFVIYGSDMDGRVLKTARQNAIKAGVEQYTNFQKLPVEEFSSRKRVAYIITNPPYGERLGEEKQVRKLYETLGNLYKNHPEWSFFVLTSYYEFEKCFRKKADKNRKLYNGRLLCYYYQYINPVKEK
ncbi:THUMP domain-containing class I SAM-dependent RNA methyltransferase [Clostridium thermarum]|uniref:THUMP domain-containing class I SAM-dependent RNA methyltransferase n=1 Tax=Clostridium thermarum TaxID=1716543 RepID=UPI0011201E87|nr:class I SAM-dependent RNA methyltransferase [Clostridium thermarum]